MNKISQIPKTMSPQMTAVFVNSLVPKRQKKKVTGGGNSVCVCVFMCKLYVILSHTPR